MADGQSEERLSGERVWTGRLFAVDVDRVRLAVGSEAVREVVRHPGAVVVVPVAREGRILLVSQFRYAVGRTLLELPAGTLGSGEQPLACGRRELAEETGHAAAAWTLLGRFYSAPGFCDEELHCFLAEDLYPAPASPDSDERIEVVAVPLDHALALVDGGEIRDAKTVAGLLLAARRSRPG
jgi:ADP-ribose pyrophosphatase